MSVPQPNAFSDPGDSRPRNQAASARSCLAAALAPLQAELEQQEHGWRLMLSPMRAFDAMRCLADLSNEDDAVILLFRVEHAADDRIGARGHAPQHGSAQTETRIASRRERRDEFAGQTLAGVAAKQNIPVIEAFEDDALVLDPAAASEIVGMIRPSRVRGLLVNGPVEFRDVRDIINASNRGESLLAVELRAIASVDVESDRIVRLESREKRDALRPVAENFRHYLGAMRRRSHNEYAAPELWQLERLFSVSGTLTVRPIETETYSTSMDIGISTSPVDVSRPADCSLIYDLPSDTWHDEP